jgi:ubiquinone/menaquinone biosynthesis C-methylase UbiE
MNSQDDIFRNGEGDQWYVRNRVGLDRQADLISTTFHDIQLLSDWLQPFRGDIQNILEIGCCNGHKIQTLCRDLDASGKGVDPSSQAVEDGNTRMRGMPAHLTCGTAEVLHFASGSFDLVYFGFCLYLMDRRTLLQALSEADRVLKAGGFLAITDFDPGVMHKRPYAHRVGVFSYKQDYSKFYTESGMYYLVSKAAFSHRQAFFDRVSDERVSLALLYKEMDAYPLKASSI